MTEQPGVDLVKHPGAAPAAAAGSDVEPAVFDAEIVDEPPRAGWPKPKARTQVTVLGARPAQLAIAAKERGPQAVARTAWTTGSGLASWARRGTSALTHGHLRKQIRLAEQAGDKEALGEWTDRLEAAKDSRQRRLKSMPQTVYAVSIGVGSLVGGALVFALLLSVAIQLTPGGADFVSFWTWVGDVLSTAGDVIVWLLAVGSLAAVPLVVYAAWREGQRVAEPPRWLQADAQRGEVGAMVTADGIVTALRHLPVPAMKKAFKDGWSPTFLLTPVREGQGAFRGYRAIFDLPMGVAPKMLADQGEVLARNLHRIPVEVWPSDHGREKGGKAGHVNLYVADSGIMDKPTPDYPLLHAGAADVFTGVPVGITQRGDLVMMPVVGSNSVFGGQPGQGKSNVVRVAVAGLALDLLCEIRVHVFALNGDFDAYEPRLALLQKGATPEHVAAATEHLERLYAEVGRREGRLAELGAKKLTRAIAEKHPDMRPLVVVFSECHEMFGKSETAGELAIDVVKRGRKTGVTLMFDTQSSRANAIPGQLVENIGFNGCFSVKTWRSNDGFLGDGSFAAGIRATELRFNVDRGTMVATGASEELFDIVRCFFIAVDDDRGWDQATEIVERAMAQLGDGQVRRLAVVPAADEDEPDDLAAILATLQGQPRTLTTTVVERLREAGGRYAKWSTGDLRKALAAARIPPRKDGDGRMVVRLDDVAGALADRLLDEE